VSLVIQNMLPIFFILTLGYFAQRFKVVANSASEPLSKILFYIVMPFALFMDISEIPLSQSLNFPYMTAYLICSAVLIGLTVYLSLRFFQRNVPETILNGMASSHTNTAFLALPIFIVVFRTTVPVASIIIVQSVLTVAILIAMDFSTHKTSNHQRLGQVAMIPLKNPILAGIFAGIIFSGVDASLPATAREMFTIIRQSAPFLALFALGCSLAESSPALHRVEKLEIGLLTVFKSALHPILGYLIGRFLFKLDPLTLKYLVVMTAMPTAKNTFIFSQKYRIGIQRSRAIVFLTTLISLVTITCTIYFLRIPIHD
jgi:malonate transporter and related proteins